MIKIRHAFIIICMLLCSKVFADVRVSIGINVPTYPQLVVVPGYPVYYAPQLDSNYFFYDGLYWVFQDGDWYESSWYNGPWWFVEPEDVPLFILRVPVRYYRVQPRFFFGWNSAYAPRWGEHWGRDWEQRRNGWDRWDHQINHAPAPLPSYQQRYSGDRYPHQVEQQHELQNKSYGYEPRDPVVRQQNQNHQYQNQQKQRAPAQQINPQREKSQHKIQQTPQDNGARQLDRQGSVPDQRSAPTQQNKADTSRTHTPQNGGMDIQRSDAVSPQQSRKPVQSRPSDTQYEQKGSRTQGLDKNQQSNDLPSGRNQRQGQDREKGRNN
jgi:hypothetical protein